jgi:transaldolase
MQLWLDTANVDEIRQGASWGVIDGVTTNPTLVAREGRKFKEVVSEITKIVDGPVSAEVISTETEGMLKEAEEYAAWHKNIVVKLPFGPAGLAATKQLSAQGVKTNVTLTFTANQTLLAAKAGATYTNIFIGRLDDISEDGMQQVRNSKQIFSNYGLKTKLIAASVRHPLHVRDAALCGCDVATVPFKVVQQMFKHPLTDSGLKQFLADWQSVPK